MRLRVDVALGLIFKPVGRSLLIHVYYLPEDCSTSAVVVRPREKQDVRGSLRTFGSVGFAFADDEGYDVRTLKISDE